MSTPIIGTIMPVQQCGEKSKLGAFPWNQTSGYPTSLPIPSRQTQVLGSSSKLQSMQAVIVTWLPDLSKFKNSDRPLSGFGHF
jgi:hypothetical protein